MAFLDGCQLWLGLSVGLWVEIPLLVDFFVLDHLLDHVLSGLLISVGSWIQMFVVGCWGVVGSRGCFYGV